MPVGRPRLKNMPGAGPLRDSRQLVEHFPHRVAPTEPMLNDTFLTTSDEVLTAIVQRSVFTVRVTSVRVSREKSYLRNEYKRSGAR